MLKFLSSSIRSADIISDEAKLRSMAETGTRHKTYFGGLLSITVTLLCLAVSGYFLSFLLIKTNPKAYQFTKYTDDAERIYFDNQEFFFILQFWNLMTNPVPETALKYVGIMVEATLTQSTILGTYYFQPCDYDRDFEGFKNVFTLDQKQDLESSWLCLAS